MLTQNIPASVPFSSVPAFQGSAVRSASAGLHAPQRRQTDFEEKVVEREFQDFLHLLDLYLLD